MFFGVPPFVGENPTEMYNKIRLAEVNFPIKYQLSVEVEDFICGVFIFFIKKKAPWKKCNK